MCQENNVTILNLIKDFEGIIGTVIGVFLGSGLTYFSQKIGRIFFFVDTWEFNFCKLAGSGEVLLNEFSSDCRYAKYKLEADCFNSSNVFKGLGIYE
jgi:hypothetical protein